MSITLVMITKNEEKNMGDCFKSVQGVISDIVVVDTGSTDKTVLLAESLGAKVFEMNWTNDFSAARNFAIEKASTPWILVLDGDERLHPADKEKLRALTSDPGAETFLLNLTTRDEMESHPLIRLFRNMPEYRYKGKVHEIIVLCGDCPPPISTDVRIIHTGHAPEDLAAQKKLERNIRLLEAELSETPQDARLLHTMGQHLEKLGRLDEALPYYKKAASGKDALGLPATYRDLANACLKLQHYGLCRKVLDFALERSPDYTDLRYLSAELYREQDDLAAAEREFRECLRLGPAPSRYPSWSRAGGSLAWRGLGDILMRTGQIAGAEEAFRNAVLLDEDDYHSLARLAAILAKRSADKTCARDEFLELADPRDPEVGTIIKEVFGE